MSKNILGRDAFFAACNTLASKSQEIEIVPCPELGGEIYVRVLTADMVEQADRGAKGDFDRAIRMVLASVVDENGQAMFESREQVGALKSPVFTALSKAVGKANKVGTPEETAKN